MVVAGINPPVVADKHIQESITRLWQNSTSRSFLALQLAKYSHREPSLTPVVLALVDSLEGDERQDRERILARLDQDPREALPRSFNWEAAQRSADHSKPSFEHGVEVRLDPELGRLALGLNLTAEFRIWSVARHHFGIPGRTTRQELFAQLEADDVQISKRHYNRLLKSGSPLFWGVDGQGRVWLRSYVKVTQRLTACALRVQPSLVATNLPGAYDMYVRVNGDIQRFKARLYAAWLAHRENPVIARSTLAALFNCTEDTLRNWESLMGSLLSVTSNWAQTALDPREDDRIFDYLPDHAYSYLTRRNKARIRWQLPNQYSPKLIRQHIYKGQSRKARTYAAMTVWNQPVESCANSAPDIRALPFDRSHRVPKRYFAKRELLEKTLKRLEKRDKVGVSPQTPRYVFRGRDKQEYGIYELSLDGTAQTTALERISIRKEYAWRSSVQQQWRTWSTLQAC